ncbi:hypothetical protein ASF61_07300 [Duganella sp. Leaf126]|nr:hypothetical protein ASF61_07300 [Duganella sp. Leaf126]
MGRMMVEGHSALFVVDGVVTSAATSTVTAPTVAASTVTTSAAVAPGIAATPTAGIRSTVIGAARWQYVGVASRGKVAFHRGGAIGVDLDDTDGAIGIGDGVLGGVLLDHGLAVMVEALRFADGSGDLVLHPHGIALGPVTVLGILGGGMGGQVGVGGMRALVQQAERCGLDAHRAIHIVMIDDHQARMRIPINGIRVGIEAIVPVMNEGNHYIGVSHLLK